MRKIYILLLALIFALPAFSQKSQSREKREDMRREMHEFKMKFIAQEIELQESQQKRFSRSMTVCGLNVANCSKRQEESRKDFAKATLRSRNTPRRVGP